MIVLSLRQKITAVHHAACFKNLGTKQYSLLQLMRVVIARLDKEQAAERFQL